LKETRQTTRTRFASRRRWRLLALSAAIAVFWLGNGSPTLEKRPVVTEEVSVGKQKMQDTQQVSGTMRREEARIEGTGEVDLERRH
jgi:hypothetical protein